MTQTAALKFLKKKPNKWFNTKQISKAIKIGSASDNLKRLYLQSEVLRRSMKGQGYEWRFK